MNSRSSSDDGTDAFRDRVRDAFAMWVSGVSVVAVRVDGKVHGLTVSAFTPVSLDPPLILVCLAGDAPVRSYLGDTERFVVNVLSVGQRGLAVRFADRFPIAPGVFADDEGDPVLPGCLASFVCMREADHPGGDHRIVVGRVVRVEFGEAGDADEEGALAWFEREYARVTS
jgi:flavin reductase (DIM6/NTAB) family NADH-FMN oxidoreductase RutF